MEKGWIKLHRKILDCEVFAGEPFSKMQAWIYLLLMANHEPREIRLGYEKVVIERGQFHTSERKLASIWGWNFKTVRRFLRVLEVEQMITKNVSTYGSTLTIVNYDNYQVGGSTEGSTKGSTKGSASGTQTRNKEIKNINNNVFTPPTLEEVTAYCRERNNDVNPKQFFDYFQAGHWIDSEGKPVRNWKQKLITWEKKGRKPQPQKPKTNNIESHDYDFDELERILQ